MKKIKKPEWLMGSRTGGHIELTKKLIDTVNELVEYLKPEADWLDEIAPKQPGHWECPAGHLAGWIPDVPEAPGHWECPAHGKGVNKTMVEGVHRCRALVDEYRTDHSFIDGVCDMPLTWIPDNWPHKYKEPEGYYWCHTCEEEKADPIHEAIPGHHVTGPHIDKCPECGASMFLQNCGPSFRMSCADSSHFYGPLKPTEAEAVLAWRKGMKGHSHHV